MKNVILFSLMMLAFLGYSQNLPKSVYSKTEWDELSPEYDVVSFNYVYLNKVQKLKKFELGIDLHGDLLDRINAFIHNIDSVEAPLNPFLEWDVRVKATFNLEGTKVIQRRDGFYYQEYRRDTRNNDWHADKKNLYPFRIRFAPPTTGVWNARISVQYKAVDGTAKLVQLPPFQFEVLENDHPGYVKISENNRNFERGGKTIFPIGHNMAGPYNGVESYGGDPSTTNKRARVDDWMAFQKDVRQYVDEGGKYIKLIQLPYSSLIEFEELGNYYNRLHYAWEQDKILDFCEKNDVLIHFNLMFQNPIMKFSQYGRTVFDFGHWDGLEKIDKRDKYRPYCYYTREGKEPYEMFLDETDLQYHKQRMRYYLARYGYSPQIYNWELISEPWHLNESFHNPNYYKTGIHEGEWIVPFDDPFHKDFKIVHKALVNYQKVISDYIKQVDDRLLVGITIHSGGPSHPWGHEDVTLDKSIFLENVDIIGINRYSNGPEKMIISKYSKNNETPAGENSEYHLANRIFELCKKPVIYSEAGSLTSCNTIFSHTTDVMTMPFNGIAGVQMWAGYSYGEGLFDERTLWSSSIKTQDFINSRKNLHDIFGKKWTQGRQVARMKGGFKRPAKEMQYYVAEDKMVGLGYVRNRTNNHKTMMEGEKCDYNYATPLDGIKDLEFKKGGKLHIEGLSKGKYIVTWFDLDGKEIGREVQKAKRSGKLKKLKHPTMNCTDSSCNAVIWFELVKQGKF
jgi:hypothetical protein